MQYEMSRCAGLAKCRGPIAPVSKMKSSRLNNQREPFNSGKGDFRAVYLQALEFAPTERGKPKRSGSRNQ